MSPKSFGSSPCLCRLSLISPRLGLYAAKKCGLLMMAFAFPFRHVVQANDATIKEYIRIANLVGFESVNWKYEWGDGGRAVFVFDTKQAHATFKFTVWLFGLRI